MYTSPRGENRDVSEGLKNDIRLFVGPPNRTDREKKPEFSYEHSFNTIGLRETDLDKVKIDSSFTIAGFGDSFTEGVGAPYDSTWVKLLSNQLKSCRTNLLCVNAGRNGSDIIYETYKFKHLILETYKPQLVIFSINTSDINDLIVRGGNERLVSENNVVYRDGPWWKYLYSFSYVWRVIAHEIIGVEWTFYTKSVYEKLEEEAKKLIYSTITDEIIPFAKNQKIQTLFVLTPMEYELDEGHSFAFTDLAADLEQSGVNVLNLHQHFAKFSGVG